MIFKLLKTTLYLGIVTLIFGTIYVSVHQSLRQGANDPQIQLAEDVARALSGGATPSSIVSNPNSIDIQKSLAVFVIIYDDQGNPVVSSGTLNGIVPKPPKGVFDYVRQYGEDGITWQPQPDVRNATVITRFKGAQSGFVLVGRSLREVEIRANRLGQFVLLGWLGSVVLILLLLAVKLLIKKKNK